MKICPTLRVSLPKPKALGVAVALACSGVAALAGDSSVLITDFSYVSSAGTLTWLDPFQSFQTTALNGGGLFGSKSDSFETDDYNFAIAGANVSNAQAAISTTAPQTFFASAATTKSANPQGTPPNQGTAIANQSGSFTLSQPGTVTFTVGYTLGVSSPCGNAITDFATALLNFNLGDGDANSGGSLSDQLASFSQLAGVGSKSGTFTLAVSLGADETGFYTLSGNAESFSIAAIPEPGEWALMGGGLFAMAAFLRRRRQMASV